MALVFGLTGNTQLAQVAAALKTAWGSPALVVAMVFLIAGFGFKIASVPFQMWVPDVYEGAPTPITAYLSVASKAAGFAIVLRVFLEALGGGISDWAMVFAVLAAISMTLGNVVAIAQNNIKRMLGYSSIAHAGYLMVGLAAVTGAGRVEDFGPTGLLFFLASYTVANLGAFFAVIAISGKINSDLIPDYSGMGKRAPLISLVLTLCLVSLIGIPPTAGFLAKLYIFNAAVHHDLIWLVVIAVLNTAISAYYYLRVAKVMWLGTPASEEKVPSSWALRTALSLASLGVLVIFFLPAPLLQIAQRAVSIFLP
jgi:NADH-quinone oxidoreductase subunit N